MDRPMHSYLLASLLALSRSHSFSSQERVPVWTEGTDASRDDFELLRLWLAGAGPSGWPWAHGPAAENERPTLCQSATWWARCL